MPIKPEDALEVIGLSADKYDTVEAFKEAVEGKYVALDAAHTNPVVSAKVLGKFNYVVRRKLGKMAKELDIELPADGEALDLIDTITDPVIGLRGELGTWKEKAEKGVAEDVLKEWQGKLTKAEKERDAFKTQAQDFGKKYEDLNTEIVNSKRKNTIEGEWSSALGSISFHDGVDELKREGFEAKLRKMYRVEVGEDGKPSLYDEKGELAKHPKRAGELLKLSEAAKMLAIERKLTNDNPHGGKPAPAAAAPPRFTPPPPAPPAPAGQRPVRQPARRWGS